jgi:2-polyprenyl-3-methyl-5-hydroxy-6-metoxy-1,4-benzoquinol methylase
MWSCSVGHNAVRRRNLQRVFGLFYEDVLKFDKLHHGYETIQTPVEKHLPELDDKFDLIIARDILEHVIDISMVIKNVKQYLKEDGIFHFITPNGHEDVWKHYLT